MIKKIVLPALALGAMGAIATSAQAYEVSSYLQASVGQSKAERTFLVKGMAGEWDSFKADRTDTAYKIIAGLNLNQYIGIEGQYVDLGKSSYKGKDYLPGIVDYTGKADLESYGLGLNLVGKYPIQDFALFAKVGYHFMHTKYSDRATNHLTGDSEKYSKSSRKMIPSFGIGASYAITNHLSLLAEYERFNGIGRGIRQSGLELVKHDVDFASVGIRYHF